MIQPFPCSLVLPVTEFEPPKVTELDAAVARQAVRQAVENCARAKAVAEGLALGAILARADVRLPVGEVKRLRIAKHRAELKARKRTSRGSVPKLARHPDLAGLSRKEYMTHLHRRRRQKLYAAGLTCRGTVRVTNAK